MATLENTFSALSRIAAFSGLDRVKHAELLEHINLKKLETGEIIFREGDAPDGIFVIKRGEIEIVRIRDGIGEPIAHLKAGDVFGELGMLTGDPRNATARAFRDAAVFHLPKDICVALAKDLQRLDLLISATYLDRSRKNKYYGVEAAGKPISIYTKEQEDTADEDE